VNQRPTSPVREIRTLGRLIPLMELESRSIQSYTEKDGWIDASSEVSN
jgi:hypothetical protein